MRCESFDWFIYTGVRAVIDLFAQVNMNDRFGKVMIDNLETRGCGLAGVQHCESLDSQKARYVISFIIIFVERRGRGKRSMR